MGEWIDVGLLICILAQIGFFFLNNINLYVCVKK